MKYCLLTLAYLILTFTVVGQSTSLTAVQVEEDVDIFIKGLREAHPGLYLHLDKTTLDQHFYELRKEAKSPNSDLRSLYRAMLKVVVAIGDGHTGLYENKPYQEAYGAMAR
ncbi:MAG: hypothetical protein AAF840_14645, partial [Bacteroidota bacterium]